MLAIYVLICLGDTDFSISPIFARHFWNKKVSALVCLLNRITMCMRNVRFVLLGFVPIGRKIFFRMCAYNQRNKKVKTKCQHLCL